jgi:hypothetical protein
MIVNKHSGFFSGCVHPCRTCTLQIIRIPMGHQMAALKKLLHFNPWQKVIDANKHISFLPGLVLQSEACGIEMNHI